MNKTPPDKDFSLSQVEVEELFPGESDPKRLANTLRQQFARWKCHRFVKVEAGSQGTCKVYPSFEAILRLCERHPDRYRDEKTGLLCSDVLKYRLSSDLYGLHLSEPTPSHHLSGGLLDFLYYPDEVKAECDEIDLAAKREPGASFGDLMRLWRIMLMGLDENLYRRSVVAFQLYAELWPNHDLKFKVGTFLARVAVYYGDYKLSLELILLLERMRKRLKNQSDKEHYEYVLASLTLNAKTHINKLTQYLEDKEHYHELYIQVTNQNDAVAAMTPRHQQRHVELIRSICRGSCRSSVRYIMGIRSRNYPIERDTLSRVVSLAVEYETPKRNIEKLNHADPARFPWDEHDLDTLARIHAVILPTQVNIQSNRKDGDEYEHGEIRSFMKKAEGLCRESENKYDKNREAEAEAIARIAGNSDLRQWVGSVNRGSLYPHSLQRFWKNTTQIILHLQHARLRTSKDNQDLVLHLSRALSQMERLNDEIHAPTFRQAGYLMLSIQHLIDGEMDRRGLRWDTDGFSGDAMED